jgi:hypothetical protein
VIGMLIGGVLGLVALIVFGVLGAVFALLFGLLVLPFKLLGFALKGVGFLIALPFLFFGGLLLLVVCGVAGLALFTPILPIALLVFAVIWLSRRRRRSAVV